MASSLQCLLQYMLLKVQSDEFISPTLIVSAIMLQHLHLQQSLQPKTAVVLLVRVKMLHMKPIHISISVSSSEINKYTETERVFKIELLMTLT